MLNKVKSFLMEEEGQGMTEYGLILGVIAVGVATVLVAMRTQILAIFNKALAEITKAAA